jgi:hypothetical protein
MGLAAANLLCPACLVAAAPCNVVTKMHLYGARKLGTGSTFRAQARLKATGSTQLANIYFQIELPDFLVPIKGAVLGHSKGGASSPIIQGRRVVFPGLTLHAKKQLKITLRIGVPQCQALGEVAIASATLQRDVNDTVTCSNIATPSTVNVVKRAHKVKRASLQLDMCNEVQLIWVLVYHGRCDIGTGFG